MGASLSALFYFLLTPFSRSVCEKISCHEIFSHTSVCPTAFLGCGISASSVDLRVWFVDCCSREGQTMRRLLARLFRISSADIRRRWQREQKARDLGLFEASPSRVVEGVADMGVRGVDRMRSDNLGAPDSAYYRDQSAEQFDRSYKRIQKKAESLIARDL